MSRNRDNFNVEIELLRLFQVTFNIYIYVYVYRKFLNVPRNRDNFIVDWNNFENGTLEIIFRITL